MECRKRPKSIPTLEHFPAKCEAVRRRTRIRKETGACSDSDGPEHALALSLAEESPARPIQTGAAERLQDRGQRPSSLHVRKIPSPAGSLCTILNTSYLFLTSACALDSMMYTDCTD